MARLKAVAFHGAAISAALCPSSQARRLKFHVWRPRVGIADELRLRPRDFLKILIPKGAVPNLSPQCSKTCAGWASTGMKVRTAEGLMRHTPKANGANSIWRPGSSFATADLFIRACVRARSWRSRRAHRTIWTMSRFIQEHAVAEPMGSASKNRRSELALPRPRWRRDC